MSHKGLHRRLGLGDGGKASQTLHWRPCPRGIPSTEAWEPFPGPAGARWGGGEPGSVYKYL